jgi:RNA polymerase sigma-70 factor (ECF subfamily)
MTASDDLFETHRRFLTRLAYRMLGSVSDAEDIVQEAWLRWRDVPQEEVEAPRAYLARTVTRLCLDQMKSARSKREFYVGAWLPEPLVGRSARRKPMSTPSSTPRSR